MNVRRLTPIGLVSVSALLAALAFSADPALAAAPEAPVTLTPAKEVTAESATLEGELNPNTSAEVTWEMFLSKPGGTSCHEGITVGGEGPLDGEAIPVETTARNLQPSSVYRFCVVAFHSGETSGNEETFKTLGAPGVPELSVEHPVGAAEANFQAVLRPEGEAGTHEPWPYHFLYKEGTSCVGGTETHYAISTGEPDEQVSERAFDLTPGTTYALCIVVDTISETTTYGPISFTTHAGFALTTFLTGEGKVESNPAGLTCESEQCSHVFEVEGPVTLTATPKPGYVFAGWLGCKRAGLLSGTCELVAPRSEVTAVFLKAAEKGEEGKAGKEGVAGKEGATGKEGQAGAAGEKGAGGAAGAQGSPGPAGAQGPAGPQGPAGKIELVTCTTVTKNVKGKKKTSQTCTTSLVSGPLHFTTAAAARKATLLRKSHVVATGTVRMVDGHVEFFSSEQRVLPRGRYTLTITRKAGRHITETREAITIT
jgi:hypothetical protein